MSSSLPHGAAEAIPPGTEMIIERLGHLGHGIGALEGVHVPFAAPGDVVRLGENGAWSLVQEGPARQKPPCPHFGACGACDLQHVADETYAASKTEWIAAALARQGILNVPIEPLVRVPAGTRRRAVFALKVVPGESLLGFHTARSDDVTLVPGCLVLRPRIKAAMGTLLKLLGPRLRRGSEASVAVTETESGLDCAADGRAAQSLALSPEEMAQAAAAGIARLTFAGEILLARETPFVRLSGVSVPLPPGAFLQAAEESEAALVAFVGAALGKAKRIADLYSGVGTFTFALARSARVDAFEGDALAVEALLAAAHGATGLKAVTAVRRDLAYRPLTVKELKVFDGAVLDPPRSGAETQARHLAQSKVKRIAYVACFPATFARDARILIEGGYRLVRVRPVDQFLWSHHVELAAEFVR